MCEAGCALIATLEDSGTMKRLLMLLGVATITIVAIPAYADPPTPPITTRTSSSSSPRPG